MAKEEPKEKARTTGPRVQMPKKTGKNVYSTVKVKSTGLAKTGPAKGEIFHLHPDLAEVMEEHGKVEIVGKVDNKGTTTT